MPLGAGPVWADRPYPRRLVRYPKQKAMTAREGDRSGGGLVNGVVEGFVVIGIVIVVGCLLGRWEVLGPAAVQVLSRVAFFIASPALLFVTLAHADIGAVFSEALIVTALRRS